MRYVDYVYEILLLDTFGLDSIYEDYIIKIVGEAGLTELRSAGCLESCGVINGRQLYALVEMKGE